LNAATTESLSQGSPREISRAQRVAGALLLFALWFVLCRHLSGEWSVNEQYSYGWFVPFFAAYLFWLRWEDRPLGQSRKEKVESRHGAIAVGIAVVALLILLPVRLFEMGNPDWRPLGWLHTAAVATLTLLIIWAAGGNAWVRHFAFPIAFFFVAVPWPASFEQTIVQGLMRVVAGVATEAVNLCGIPAQLEGSLIRVSSGLVGVNEACSGVRSLQTSLMIGLLFGELKRLSIARRFLLVVAALGIALVANFGRAFFLVWIAATQDTSAVGRWHDFAGYTIVAAVFLGSVFLARSLGRGGKAESRKQQVEKEKAFQRFSFFPVPSFLLSAFSFLICFLFLLAIEIGVEVWYRSHEAQAVRREQWTVRWPESAPGFRETPIDEGVKSILRFDSGREASWSLTPKSAEGQTRRGEDDTEVVPPAPKDAGPRDLKPARAFLFFFRWQPGASSVLRARAHRPDICLPSAGWRQTADAGVRAYPVNDHLVLPFRHFSFERDLSGQRHLFAHAFFCVHEDFARPIKNAALRFDPNSQTPNDWLFADRWNVVREGLRNQGQQVMQFMVLTENEIPSEVAERDFASIVRGLVVDRR
jgi:exosortase